MTVLASASSGQSQFYNCATVTSESQPRNTQLDKVLLRTISTALKTEWSSCTYRAKMEKHAENVTPSTRCDPWRSVAGCFAGGSNFCLQDVWTSNAKSASQSAVTRGRYVQGVCKQRPLSCRLGVLRLPTSNCQLYKQCTVLPPSFPTLPIAHTITLCT